MKKYFKITVHIVIWLVLVLLLNSKTFDLSWGAFDRSHGSLILPLLYGTALGAFIFYINIFKLIPKHFGKKNKQYLWIAFGWFIGVTLLEMLLDIVVLLTENAGLAGQHFKQASTADISLWFFMVFVSAFVPNLACWILAFAYRLPKDWILAEKQKSQLEKDKLQSELDFLRAQINPHFLFNGINSIYHLIGDDDTMARNTLLQFSGLLRYQLYDCSVNYISLEKELQYIHNYINIEKVRKGEDAVFNFSLPEIENNSTIASFKIAPLLITPFLENAFKYLSFHANREKNCIDLDLEIMQSGILNLKLVNSYDHTIKRGEKSSGGIGLENVKRRLDILYSDGKHRLEVSDAGDKFIVNLMINLNED